MSKRDRDSAEPLPFPRQKVPRDKFHVITDLDFGDEIRRYVFHHRITFNELGNAALREYLARHRRWPGPPVRMPRGRRLGVRSEK